MKPFIRNTIILISCCLVLILVLNWNTNTTTPTTLITETTANQSIYPINSTFTIASGASANHFCALHAWLYRTHTAISLEYSNIPRPRVVIYDLGLQQWQITLLNSLKSAGIFTELRKFDYSKYPDFWNISVNRGEYGWKVGVLSEIVREFPGIVVWLDSGSFMKTPFLRNIDKLLENDKCIASPTSPGSFFEWTHSGIFSYYGVPLPEEFRHIRNCSGGVLVFNTHTVSKLLEELLNCALNKDCIAPPGSNRKNHRQDQAALTYLSAREGCFCTKNTTKFNVINHMDSDCAENIVRFEQLNSVPWNIAEQDRLGMKKFKNRHKGQWWELLWEVES